MNAPPRSRISEALFQQLRTLRVSNFGDCDRYRFHRLVSRRNREIKELRTLQEIRKAKETEGLNAAAKIALAAEHNRQPFQLETLGFEFTAQDFSTYMARLTPSMKQNLLKESLQPPPQPPHKQEGTKRGLSPFCSFLT